MNIIEETGRNTGRGSYDVGTVYFHKSMGIRKRWSGNGEEAL